MRLLKLYVLRWVSIMALCLFSVNVFAEVFEVDEIAYSTLSENTVEVYGEIDRECKYAGEINIPETIQHNGVCYSVNAIGNGAFWEGVDIISIKIPNSIISIGEGAFCLCDGLTSLAIPNSVTEIGNRAFAGCTGLTSINIPESVTEIEDYAFSGCTGLTSITIPNSVTEIGRDAFFVCTGLTSITIPVETHIEGYAFPETTKIIRK